MRGADSTEVVVGMDETRGEDNLERKTLVLQNMPGFSVEVFSFSSCHKVRLAEGFHER
jgi:hypothetical protein